MNLTDKEKEQFPPLCPDFVIEIKSASDVLASLINKMNEWIGNGTRLAWLVNSEEKLNLCFYLRWRDAYRFIRRNSDR